MSYRPRDVVRSFYRTAQAARVREWSTVSAFGSLVVTPTRFHMPTAVDPKPSLYERLGGVYAIAVVVDDFINRVMDNPALNANPKVDEAHHRVSRAGFKYLVTEMVCWAAGGPQCYTGKSMLDSHEHLEITEEEWQVFLADFRACLDHF